ncbi:MAG: phage baseplate assembly protein V [bacterium]
MTIGLAQLISERESEQGRSLTAGVVIGLVTNNNDPDGLSRVKVKFPWLSGLNESYWARVASPMAGNDRGAFFLPEIDDEVLVMFAHGDVRFPYVIGSLWNGKDKPPADNADGKNNVRVIKSRSGHVIRLNDEDGKETLEIVDGTGKNSVVIDTATNSITISADGDITLAAPNGAIRLSGKAIDIESSADSTLSAGTSMTVKAGGALNAVGQPVNLN